MIIPHSEIPSETLQALIEEIVTRDGTDYGAHEQPTSVKVQQVLEQLNQKTIFISYSELHETCTLVTKEATKGILSKG